MGSSRIDLTGLKLRLSTPYFSRPSLLASTCFFLSLLGCSPSETPIPETSAQFAPNTECVECHQKEASEWQGSHHQLAMQHASEETVLGDFNNTTFQYFDLTSRFFKNEDGFFVNTEGPDGNLADFQIKYVFGLEPLQQYLVEFPGGKIQSLTIAWDTEKQRWFHLYPDERIESDDPLHWTGVYQNWNAMCAECHTTNLRKNYNSESDTYDTAWSEINVSCQACHGPGEPHVEWARVKEEDPGAEDLPDFGLLVDFAGNSSFYQVDRCAPCHSRRGRLDSKYEHHKPCQSRCNINCLYLPVNMLRLQF